MALADFIADTSGEPKLRAWVFRESEQEADLPPLMPRQDGWRITIAHANPSVSTEPVRMTWEPTLAEALPHMNYYWPEPPKWRRQDTGQEVDLHALTRQAWEKWELE